MTEINKTSTTKDDQPKIPSTHDTQHPTDDDLRNLDVTTVPPLPHTDHHLLKSEPKDTHTRNNSNSSSADSSSLPSAFSDRTEQTCTTDKTSNTASRHIPDPFKSNGSPRQPHPASQPPTITPADTISDDDKSQHFPDKVPDTLENADSVTSPSTSGSKSSEGDYDSDDSAPNEPTLCPPPGTFALESKNRPTLTQSLETVTRREFAGMQKASRNAKENMSTCSRELTVLIPNSARKKISNDSRTIGKTLSTTDKKKT